MPLADMMAMAWRITPAAMAGWLTRHQPVNGGQWTRAPHLSLLSDWLTDAAIGQRRRILCTMPPQHGKSSMISQWFPVWLLENWPTKRILLVSYAADYATSWGRKVRNAIQQHSKELTVRISQDSAAAAVWTTTAGGQMVSVGVGGQVAGRPADVLIIDDPYSGPDDAMSQLYRDRLWEWWQTNAYTRLAPDGIIVILHTRWHEDDLIGRVVRAMREGGERWDLLNLPAIAEVDGDPLGRRIGDPLWGTRYDQAVLRRIRENVGTRAWAALYQQRPSPDTGNIFQRNWWRSYRALPNDLTDFIQSWDLTFKDTRKADYVVGQVWARRGADKYLIDQVRARMDITATIQAIRGLSAKWPLAIAKLIEDKANGPAVMSMLRHELTGLLPVEPEGGKVARANAVAPEVEAGNVYLPDPSIAPWVHDFIEEASAFPNAPNDDQIDSLTQALRYYQDRVLDLSGVESGGRRPTSRREAHDQDDDDRPGRRAGGRFQLD